MQRLMRDSSKTEAEQTLQRKFRKSALISGTLLAFAVLLFRSELKRLPNRSELGLRTTSLHYQPVALGGGSGSGAPVVEAWRLLADDPRFGGLSALALSNGQFVALTDSGGVARFPKPRRGAFLNLRELPSGPGDKAFKLNRDSEALAADPLGRGWWVAFENRDQIWLYDDTFGRAFRHVAIKDAGLARNRGIEGIIASRDALLLFPESGGRVIRPGSRSTASIEGVPGWISDAARLPDGRLAVIARRPTLIGFHNRLFVLEPAGRGYRATKTWRIPVGRLDNVEGLAAEPLPGGAMRLWMVTDNNLQQRRRTLLVAVEIRPQPARQ